MTPGDDHARTGGRLAGRTRRARRRQRSRRRRRAAPRARHRPSRKLPPRPKPPASADAQAGAQEDQAASDQRPVIGRLAFGATGRAWTTLRSGLLTPVAAMKRPHEPIPPSLQRRPRRLHRRAARQGRHPRDRARLRPEERRPRRAQAHAARACGRGPRRAPPQEAAPSRHPAPCRARRRHRRATRRRTDRGPDRMGRGRARPGPENPHPRCRAARGPDEVAGVGDRALLRVEDSGDKDDAVRHTGRVIKLIDRAKQRVLGIFRALPGGGGRLEPIDKKQLGRELAIPPGAGGGRAQTAIWSRSRWRRAGAATGSPNARVTERLGSLKTRARRQPDRHPRPRDPACISRRGAGGGGGGASRRGSPDARTGASCRSSPSIRPTPRITTTPCTRRAIPTRTIPAASSSASPSPTSRITCGRARRSTAKRSMRGNSVYFPDRVVPMLPERISNDLCSLRPGEDRAALAVRMVIGADGRKRSHSFHRVLMRSAAKLNYVQAQAAVDGWPDETTGPLLASDARAALCRLSRAQARARRTRPARPRSARAQDRADAAQHRRSGDDAGAARRAPADRGIHDPRQCGGRGDARARARAADLSRPRRARSRAGERAARVSAKRSTSRCRRPARCGPSSSTASSRG